MLRDVVEVELSSGVTVYVTPLTVFAQKALIEAAEQEFPSPDVSAYARPLPDALVEGSMIPGEENPAYQRERVKALTQQRESYIVRAVNSGVHLSPDSIDALYDLHADYLGDLEAEGVAVPPARETALIRFVALRTGADMNIVVAALESRLPLTEGEIRDAMRIFRPALRESRPGQHPGTSPAQSAADEV
ncbi:MAG: hypothetical protein E6Q97_25100 [Desulfurellales bacterium]|nr:MAG: hypothetical protein E6Q97_25100 [Desulfurellales bacterium]